MLSIPTLLRLELTTVEFIVVPVKVPAAAGTFIFAVPSNCTPLIVLDVSNFVAVKAFPVNVAPTNLEARISLK